MPVAKHEHGLLRSRAAGRCCSATEVGHWRRPRRPGCSAGRGRCCQGVSAATRLCGGMLRHKLMHHAARQPARHELYSPTGFTACFEHCGKHLCDAPCLLSEQQSIPARLLGAIAGLRSRRRQPRRRPRAPRPQHTRPRSRSCGRPRAPLATRPATSRAPRRVQCGAACRPCGLWLECC
jgi:hypothetical protein